MSEHPITLKGAEHCHTQANMKPSDVLREIIVLHALRGIDTPYRNGGQEAYKGADCANFGITPYKLAGLINEGLRIPHQHKDWMLGKDINPFIFREFILQFAEEVPFDDRKPADMVSFLWQGIESHVGIITQIDPDWFVHAPSGEAVKFQKLMQATSLKSIYRHKKILELEANGQ